MVTRLLHMLCMCAALLAGGVEGAFVAPSTPLQGAGLRQVSCALAKFTMVQAAPPAKLELPKAKLEALAVNKRVRFRTRVE
jgi:hypothetical protein